MKIKPGVQLSGIQPEMLIGLMVIEPMFSAKGVDLVITSCTDSEHSNMSRHYIGYGLDIRTRDFDPDDLIPFEQELQLALGAEFYLKFEVNHYHLQFNGSKR